MGRPVTTDEDITFGQMTKMTSTLPGWLHARAKKIAKQKGISLHCWVEILVKRAIEDYERGGI